MSTLSRIFLISLALGHELSPTATSRWEAMGCGLRPTGLKHVTSTASASERLAFVIDNHDDPSDGGLGLSMKLIISPGNKGSFISSFPIFVPYTINFLFHEGIIFLKMFNF
jgi:hypothetical protein